ncbi:hypothetical protein KKG05_02610 [bacterium]|nr:hypothetical protein [bacterium]MBU1936263.1 hypothetical protein [bacterium]
MFYIDLPWYALIIWAVFALVLLLPWVAIPVIGISALFKGIFGTRKVDARAPVGFQVPSRELGLTMADGGEKLEKDSEEKTDK